MKEGLKKPLRAFALLSLVEVVLTLVVGTIAWAVAKHDLASLDGSFYEAVRRYELFAKITGAFALAIVLVNVVGVLAIAIKGEKLVALGALIMTGGIASFFFLPIRFSVYGLGGGVGLLVAYKLLRMSWSAIAWLPRKILGRRTPKDGKPAPQAATKTKSS